MCGPTDDARVEADLSLVSEMQTVTTTLTPDHRVRDGHCGGPPLSISDDLLQAPEDL